MYPSFKHSGYGDNEPVDVSGPEGGQHVKAVRQIDRALQELQEQASQTDKASRIMELDTHIQTIAQVLRLLQGDNEILFNTDLFVTAYDYEYTEDLARWEQERKDSAVLPETSVKRANTRSLQTFSSSLATRNASS